MDRHAQSLRCGDQYGLQISAVAVADDVTCPIVGVVKAVAERRGASPAQVALAWLLAQGPDVVPIPGAKRRVTLEDSMAAAELALTADDVAEIS
ncbi:MAG: aldo/keto reductase, partial [Novosphingobium sp.]